MPGEREFSVYQFFINGYNERVVEWVDPQTAVETAASLVQSVGAVAGLIRRIIITDGGDLTCFEWRVGEGVVFPHRDEAGNFVEGDGAQ